MCGIAGKYNIDTSINALLLEQFNRGPDAMAVRKYQLKNNSILYLGHNRLKIVCLSDAANQPFQDQYSQYALVFNGEIYNHQQIRSELARVGFQFHTTSDTEVLFKALIHWGMKALDKLNGMFAFGFFDSNAQKLYLVRDRFGIKPLYYHINNNQLIFASTSATIANQLNLQPNYSYLQKGIYYGIYEDDTEGTTYQDLYSVRPGCYLSIAFSDRLHWSQIRYYDLSNRVRLLQETIAHNPQTQLADMIFERLSSACHLRLNADVPVAIALSGGLDSSAIAAVSSEHKASLHSFCFGNPNDPSSEGMLAAELSRKLSIKTEFVSPSDNEWEDGFWETLAHQDAPFSGISVVAQYLLYQKISQRGFKVVLGGQGGDEGFLGYRKFQLFYLKELVEKKNWLQAARFFMCFSQMLWSERARLMMFWQLRSRYRSAQKQQHQSLFFPTQLEALNMGYSGDISQRQVDDVLKYSLPTLLRYEDRNSMAHSIESRLPFMDYELMELACALPIAMKLKRGYGKWLLRDLMDKFIPDEIRLARYKRGFDVPQFEHVFECLNPSIQAHLSSHSEIIKSMIGDMNLSEYFSPKSFSIHPSRFNELTTLCWLGMRE